MPRYLICQKIRTVANVDYREHIKGFFFREFEPERGLLGEAWEARNEAHGESFRDAFTKSRQALLSLVDAISVVTQCSTSLLATSFCVYKLEQNHDRVMYLYVARRRFPVGITLWEEDQVRDIEKLCNLPGVALNFLRESNNASTPKARLAMLIAASESLAGDRGDTGKCSNCGFEYPRSGADKTKLRRILGEQAYDRLYEKNSGALRHRLFHGSGAPEEAVGEVLPIVYNRIRSHLQRELALESFEEIVGAPRTFDSFEHAGLFVQCRGPDLPTLQTLEKDWQTICDLIQEDPQGY